MSDQTNILRIKRKYIVKDRTSYEFIKLQYLKELDDYTQQMSNRENIEFYLQKKEEYLITIIYELYCYTQFFPGEWTDNIFKIWGFEKDFYSKYMISFDELDIILDEIKFQDIIFSYTEMLSLVHSQLRANFLLKILKNNFSDQDLTYDKKKGVSQLYIQISNLFRRAKYSGEEAPKFNDDFEKMLFEQYSSVYSMLDQFKQVEGIEIKELDFETALKNISRGKHPYHEWTKSIFRTMIEFNYSLGQSLSSLEIKKAFKKLFHLIYEDDISGLLTETSFKNTHYLYRESYNDSYPKYYNTRLKSLINI